MVSQQRSFHLIECPTSVSSSHARLVVNGCGVPPESLTVFYEELQKMHGVPLLSRLWQVIAPLRFPLRSRSALPQTSIDEGGREALVQSISPFSPCLEQPLLHDCS